MISLKNLIKNLFLLLPVVFLIGIILVFLSAGQAILLAPLFYLLLWIFVGLAVFGLILSAIYKDYLLMSLNSSYLIYFAMNYLYANETFYNSLVKHLSLLATYRIILIIFPIIYGVIALVSMIKNKKKFNAFLFPVHF